MKNVSTEHYSYPSLDSVCSKTPKELHRSVLTRISVPASIEEAKVRMIAESSTPEAINAKIVLELVYNERFLEQLFTVPEEDQDDKVPMNHFVSSSVLINYSIIPNPASDQFSVQFFEPLTEELVVSVFDVAGRMIITQPVNAGNYEVAFNTQFWQQGVYLIVLRSVHGNNTQKLVISKF